MNIRSYNGITPLLGERVAVTTSLARDTQGNVSANALSLRSGGR